MSKLVWDKTGERFYETGVSQCALYPQTSGAYPKGVAWNGITSIIESPSGAEPSATYADNIKYLTLMSAEDFAATIAALSYPPEFAACNGFAELAEGVMIGQQKRTPFGLCYKSQIGNDTDGDEHAYMLNIIYGALASPSEKSRNTISDSPEPMEMSFEVSTTPVTVTGHKPTAHLTIDSRKADPTKLEALEKILYGSDEPEAAEPRLPLPDEIATLMTAG